MTIEVLGTGYRTSGRSVRNAAQIISLHGDPFDKSMTTAMNAEIYGATYIFDGLHATGHAVQRPWTGASWATNTDAYGHGGHGIGVIDTLFPTGPLHLIGTSMGGTHSTVWASRHPERVASLTLVSPALDQLDIWDRLNGNLILDPVAKEIATCWTGSETTTHAALEAALVADGTDFATVTAALAPIADRVFVVCATNDSIGLCPKAQAFATALSLPPERAVFFNTGDPNETHPAPYNASLGWDALTTLRQVQAHS